MALGDDRDWDVEMIPVHAEALDDCTSYVIVIPFSRVSRNIPRELNAVLVLAVFVGDPVGYVEVVFITARRLHGAPSGGHRAVLGLSVTGVVGHTQEALEGNLRGGADGHIQAPPSHHAVPPDCDGVRGGDFRWVLGGSRMSWEEGLARVVWCSSGEGEGHVDA